MASRVSVELWYKILGYLDRPTLKNVRLALPSANGAATALLFQHILLRYYMPDIPFLLALAGGKTDVGNHIRRITLQIPSERPTTFVGRLYNAPDRSFAKISRLLLRAAPRFTSLQQLSIYIILPSGPTPKSDKALRLFMERLPPRTFITLTVLNFIDYPRRLGVPAQFCVFSRLQSLDVAMDDVEDPTWLIRRILAENLDLREFAVRFMDVCRTAPLMDRMLGALFNTSFLDPKVHLRQLHTLRLKGLTISPDVVPVMVPFLHGVRNLVLEDIHDIAYSFWNALADEKIHCHTITMHNSFVGDAFLDYASSYVDTIREISLSWDWRAYHPSFGRYPMGRRFWTQVIGQHASSLRSLVVKAIPLSDGGGWLMEVDDMILLKTCPNLTKCDVSCPTLIKGMVW